MSNSLTINRSSYIGPFFKKKISPTFPLFILEVALDFVWHKWPWQKEQTAAGALKTGRVFAVSSPPPQFVHTRVSPDKVGKNEKRAFFQHKLSQCEVFAQPSLSIGIISLFFQPSPFLPRSLSVGQSNRFLLPPPFQNDPAPVVR